MVKGIVPQSHILDDNGVWYCSFWSWICPQGPGMAEQLRCHFKSLQNNMTVMPLVPFACSLFMTMLTLHHFFLKQMIKQTNLSG